MYEHQCLPVVSSTLIDGLVRRYALTTTFELSILLYYGSAIVFLFLMIIFAAFWFAEYDVYCIKISQYQNRKWRTTSFSCFRFSAIHFCIHTHTCNIYIIFKNGFLICVGLTRKNVLPNRAENRLIKAHANGHNKSQHCWAQQCWELLALVAWYMQTNTTPANIMGVRSLLWL